MLIICVYYVKGSWLILLRFGVLLNGVMEGERVKWFEGICKDDWNNRF